MMNNIKNGIKMQRKSKQLSQRALGKALGISRSKVSNWEIGRRDLTVGEAVEVANFFEISLEELVNPKED